MNKKLIGLAIIPIIGLIFIISTPDSELNPSDENTKEHSISIPDESLEIHTSQYSLQECSGSTKCFIGDVTKILDGDTIHVDDQSVRFALASAPELNGYGGINSKNFVETICPVGSQVLVDEDDGQLPEGHSRIIGVIYCNDMILNKELLDSGLGYLEKRFCDSSEFASSSWAQRHGCENLFSEQDTTSEKSPNNQQQCNPSYPDVCIPNLPPDLNCDDIPYKNFKALPTDPHRFDGDKDGIGCET